MSPGKGKLTPLAAVGVLREVRRGAAHRGPLAVGGARELVPVLARALREGGDASTVVEDRLDGVSGLIWVGAPDEERLREANRRDLPIIAVTDADTVPYVLATDVVRVPPGQGFPLEEIGAALGRRLGDAAIPLAARLPVLRKPVCDALIARFSKKNAVIAAAVFIPGVDLPILTLNEIRLVTRIALAHGAELDGSRFPELLGVVGAGLGFRAIARELLDAIPVAGWAVKAGVAYGGTRAIGEAAVRYFEVRSPD
jgi:uncharacterized protein (DUF697 family)